MTWVRVFLVMSFLTVVAGRVDADIFEHARPADSALREFLADDRTAYYSQTPGRDHQENEERISNVKMLGVDLPAGARGLRDMDKAFDLYLREQLQKDRDYKNLVALNHPLLLLEYASPVLADVVKHYRMTSYERLGIEQMRLDGINRATEGRTERLIHESERSCLQKNESRGLVAAMRLCQATARPMEHLKGIDGGSLEDGRRKIHVIQDALSRLGFDKARIDKIVDITGDRVISNDRDEERFPEMTFERRVVHTRQLLIRQWRELLEKFHKTGRASPAGLQDLSMPGVPLTARFLADLDLHDRHEQETLVFKFSAMLAFFQTERIYRQAAGYLELCLRDPLLPEEVRRIIGDKKSLLEEAVLVAEKDRSGLDVYKSLFAAVAQSADMSRERLRKAAIKERVFSSLGQGFMLHF